MRTGALITGTIISGMLLSGCAGAGEGSGPGYLFHLIFILAPMIAIGVLLLKRSESTNESLYILEGQLKRLSAKLDGLEEKISGIADKEGKGKTKKQ